MQHIFKPKLLLKRSGEVYADGEYFVKGVLRTFKADTKSGLRRIIEQHLNAKFLI